MRAPLTFAWRNVVFGCDLHDAWGLYRVGMQSYAGLTTTAKLGVLGQVAAFATAIEADFQVLRVSRGWSGDDYRESAATVADAEHGHPEHVRALVDDHVAALDVDAVCRPELFVAVRLGEERRGGGLSRWLGLRQAAGMSQREVDRVLDVEAQTFGRVADYLDAERASTSELQWLVRRAMSRGAGEPWCDAFWAPQALVLDAEDEEAGRRFVPFEADVLRLFEEPIDVEAEHLQIRASHQAVLVCGALPETVAFPGRTAELLFAPLESLDFAVDACFAARWLGNDRALSLVRRRIVDADHAYREESMGDHGPGSATAVRPDLARELEEQLTATDRPPLLRGQVSYVVSADSRELLEERVRLLRRELAPVQLHRPVDSQLSAWCSHLPGQLPPIRRYDDVFLPEQVGAMVPTATHAVGADVGLVIGHTLSGSRLPVMFDVTEGSRTSRPPSVLCTGTLGSGKTMTAQLLALHGLLRGSRIVDLDPKGDHRMADVLSPELVETIELTTADGHRGRLDPLRIAPPDLQVELAYSFLCELLPSPVPPTWQTKVRAAVQVAVDRGARSLDVVLELLEQGGADAKEAGRAIAVHATGGLIALGFGDRDEPVEALGDHALTSLRIANLTLPAPGTPSADLSAEERTGRALLRLLAVLALQLASSDWGRHKVLVIEELSQLVTDQVGVGLVERIVRLSRAQNVTPVLVTQVVEDVGRLQDLVGCLMSFGVETDAQAGRVLRLHGLDPDDDEARAQLRSFRRGRCLMRDYDGRVSPVQIDLMDPDLLRALDTTPRHATDR